MSQVRQTEAPAVLVIDGVQLTSPNAFNQDLFDIQQIEVMKGPQGALYGRSATAGAILITTVSPTNETDGSVSIGAGNGNMIKGNASVGGALIEDKLLYRVAASLFDTDGYLTNPTRGEKFDFHQEFGARLRLIWTPNDRTTADFRYSYSDVDTGGGKFTLLDITGATPGDPNDVPPVTSNRFGFSDRRMDTFALKLDWELDAGTFTSITSYDELEESLTEDVDFTADGINGGLRAALSGVPGAVCATVNTFFPFCGVVSITRDHEAFSQELRFTSPDDRRLRWLAGAYFVKTDFQRTRFSGLDAIGGIGRVPIIRPDNVPASAFDPVDGIVAFPPPDFNLALGPGLGNRLFFLHDDNDNTAYAFFASTSYDINDAFELTVSLRYDVDDREITNLSPIEYQPFGLTPVPVGFSISEEFSKLQPKVELRWQPSDNITTYASWGEGFRSGGFMQFGVSEASTNSGLLGTNDSWDSEETDNFEIGMKGVFLDDRLQLNLAAFYTEIEDMFAFIFFAPVVAQVIANVEKVETYGFEIDAIYSAGNWDLFAAYGVTESEVKANSFILEDRSVAVISGSGDTFDGIGAAAPQVPDYTVNTGFQYSGEIGSDWNMSFRVDWERLGPMTFDVWDIATRDALDFVNARLSFGNISNDWRVTLWGRNLNDERYNTEYDPFTPTGHPNRPRTYGIDFTKSF